MMRAAAEKLTRGLCYRKRMPKEFGRNPIWVSPSAGLKYLLKGIASVDPVLFRLAREFIKSGNVVWDIGANLGLFTFAAAHVSGKSGLVIALEPDVWLVQLLRRSCLIQSAASAPVQVIPAAAAQSVDLRTFCIARRARSANFLKGYGSSQTGGVVEEQIAITLTLDWLAERLPHPDVLKIDVEGAELEVLNGAIGLLERKRPILLCEVSSEISQAVTKLLRANRYKIYNGEIDRGQRAELSSAPWSTIAIPE